MSFGLGAGAHGFVKTDDGGIRWSNILQPEKYMSHALRGRLPEAERRPLDPLECREDRIMMGLRMDAGIRADSELRAAYGHGVERLVSEGLLVDDGVYWRATEEGRLLLDTLIFRLIDGW